MLEDDQSSCYNLEILDYVICNTKYREKCERKEKYEKNVIYMFI